MYYDQISIKPIAYDPTLFIIFTLISVTLAVVAFVLWMLERRAKKLDQKPKYIARYTKLLKAVGVMTVIVIAAGLIAGVVRNDMNGYEVADRQRDALIEQLGYGPVTVTRGSGEEPNAFVGRTKDGLYGSGQLIEVEPETYILKMDED